MRLNFEIQRSAGDAGSRRSNRWYPGPSGGLSDLPNAIYSRTLPLCFDRRNGILLLTAISVRDFLNRGCVSGEYESVLGDHLSISTLRIVSLGSICLGDHA